MKNEIDRKALGPGEVGGDINRDGHLVVVWNANGVLKVTFLEKSDIDRLFVRETEVKTKRIFRDL